MYSSVGSILLETTVWWQRRHQLHRHQCPPLIVAPAVIVAIASWLLPHGYTYRGIRSEKEKGRKSLFLFTAQQIDKSKSGPELKEQVVIVKEHIKLTESYFTVENCQLKLTP
jgi:hypothetical protein